MEVYDLVLTRGEATFLDDAIRLLELGAAAVVDSNHSNPYAERLGFLHKIGSVLLATTEVVVNHDTKAESKPPDELSIPVTEVDLLLIREYARSSSQMGNECVGIHLKLKAHAGLRELASREAVEAFADIVATAPKEGGDTNGQHPNQTRRHAKDRPKHGA